MTETATATVAEPTDAPVADTTPQPINTDSLGKQLSEQLKPEPVRERGTDGKFRKREATAEQVAAEGAPVQPAEPPNTQTPEDEGAEPATGPEEIEITEDDATQPGKPPLIEPPESWSPEAKALFAKLPPEFQPLASEWTKRESERDGHLRSKSAELAEARKKFEAEMEPIKAQAQLERQQLQQAIQQYANPKVAQFRADFADLLSGKITETQLVQDQTIRFAADGTDRWDLYQAYQTEFNSIQRAMNYAQEKAEETRKGEFQKFRDSETAKYRESHKLTDEAAWETHSEELHKYGEKQGFKPNELAYADARHMTILKSAMEATREKDSYLTEAKKLGFKEADLNMAQDAIRYRKAVAARRTAEANPQQPVLPKVVKPGVATIQPSAESQKVQALKSQFKNKGSVDNLAKLINAAN